jgi:ubiquinone/menaquinone biosynthesis C-methylase UbiE/uncharacterized protein YbaR (Trm112 family)
VRPRLLNWLVCPLSKGELKLRVKEARQISVSEKERGIISAIKQIESEEIDKDILTGALACEECKIYFPILNGVPRMLTYPCDVTRVFSEQNKIWIEENLAGYQLPNENPTRGEEEVLRNFSTEWTNYEWTGESYWSVTPENMLRCKRYELGLDKHSLKHKLVLEVGIGIGGTADLISRNEECELIGVDLGYAVDQARRYFGDNNLLHIVQASVFALPFRDETFDAVYSHGVLHHTYSTEEAFKSVARLPKPNGMFYVWLYSHEHEQVTMVRRLLMGIENVSRPVLSRLPGALQTIALSPTVPVYMLYQNVYMRRKVGEARTAKYGWNEALHAARDRLTPPFAFRHTYEEVANWFASAKFRKLEMLRDEKLPEGVPETYCQNVGIRGFKCAE